MTTLVFVYGTLRAGGSHWRRLLSPLKGSNGSTAAEFTMRSHGHYPSIHRGGLTSIRGEVMAVHADQLTALDQLEGHPDWYYREEITISLDHGGTLLAWVYLMPPDAHVDLKIIASGDWAAHQQELG